MFCLWDRQSRGFLLNVSTVVCQVVSVDVDVRLSGVHKCCVTWSAEAHRLVIGCDARAVVCSPHPAAAAADAVKTTASHAVSAIALKVQDISATNQIAGDTTRRRINLLYTGRKQT